MACLYLWFPDLPDRKVRSCQVRNLTAAPDTLDVERMRDGCRMHSQVLKRGTHVDKATSDRPNGERRVANQQVRTCRWRFGCGSCVVW